MNVFYDERRDSYRLLWSEGGKRKQLFLGKVAEGYAWDVLRHCRTLLEFKLGGGLLSRDTVRWCHEIDIPLRNKLAKLGLVDESTAVGYVNMATLFDRFYSERSVNWQPSTQRNWDLSRRYATSYFAEQHADEIKPEQAPAYHKWLKGQGLGSATIRKVYDHARAVCRLGAKRRLIPENPFADYLPAVNHNRKRSHYVARETIDAVAELCDPQARLVLYLARYAGLRISSESATLQWRFVDQKPGYLFVRTRKLETIAPRKADRNCPIFSKLREEIERYRKHVEQFGTVHPDQLMLSRRAHDEQVVKAIQQAGITRWPKLFTNLRASCITDMGDVYSENRIAKWLGTSIEIVKRYIVERGEMDTRKDPFSS